MYTGNDQRTDRRAGSDIADVYVGVHRERQRGRRGKREEGRGRGNVTAGVGVNANANANVNANGVDVVRRKPRSTFANGLADRHVAAFSSIIDYQRFNTSPISQSIEAAVRLVARLFSNGRNIASICLCHEKKRI